jgi:HAE1 family hydrophobic/amphiphilic exporter-1
VSFTIPSMTVALAAVFIPVIFMGGIVGRLLNEFAVTIVIAVVISGIVSLTLTPMLCAKLIKPAEEEHSKRHNWFYRISERGFEATQNGYASSLKWSLRHRRFIFVIFLASVAATVQMFRIMPQDFLPSEDSNQLNATTEGANGISFAEMRRHQEEAERIFAAEPSIEGVQSSVNNSNRGNFSIQMKGRGEIASRFHADPGDQRDHAEPPTDPDWRSQHPGALSIHASGRRSGRAVFELGQDDGRDVEQSDVHGREHGPEPDDSVDQRRD